MVHPLSTKQLIKITLIITISLSLIIMLISVYIYDLDISIDQINVKMNIGGIKDIQINQSPEYLEINPTHPKKLNASTPISQVRYKNIIATDDSIIINNLSRFCVYKSRTRGGESMFPLLSTNTTFLVNKCFNELAIGDIVVFEDKLNYFKKYGTIIHRITYIGYDEEGVFYLTTGDNNDRDDDIILRNEDIVGRVFGIIY